MEKTAIYDYYAFGFNHSALIRGLKDNPIHGAGSLESRINEFFSHVRDLNLQVTSQAAGSLRNIMKRVKELPKDAKVDDGLSREVSRAVNEIDKTLDAELQLHHAFVVTPKRFHLDHLLEAPNQLFAEDVFLLLPDLCCRDLTEACKCIAYGLSTAAAFHLMRATEGTLRFFYCTTVKRGRIKILMWGPMIDHLRKRKDCPSQTLIDHLDHIRVNFRNPTQHPEATYDIDGAQDLLAVCIDAINRMVRDLLDRKMIEKPDIPF